jgi:hypothetical protein
MLVERYYLYSVVCISVTYLLAIMLTEGKFRMIFGIIALLLSITFCWHSYYQAIPQVIYFERTHEADIYDLKHHRTTNNKMFGFNAETLTLFEKTLNRKIYNFPISRFDTLETKLMQTPITQTNLLPQFDLKQSVQNIDVYGGVKVIEFHQEDYSLSQLDKKNTFFIVLKNESTNEIYLIAPYISSAFRKDFLFKNKVFGNSFSFLIQQDSVKKGKYRIGILIFEDGKTALKYTSNVVNVDNTKMIDYLQQFGFYL